MVKAKSSRKRLRYGSYYWIDPKTKLGYAKVQIPTGERDAKGRIKYKTIMRRADSLTHADQIAREILDEYATRGKAFLDGRVMTFKKLAEWYKDEFVIEPIYLGDKKVAGMRGYQNERNKIDRLIESLGNYPIEEIDEFVLRRYKLKRLKDGIKPATINRDFETIRAMMRKAVKKKWKKDLIDFSDLIDKSLEERRTVTITDAQETAILAEAKKLTYAPRIFALIVALRDTGARPNELYPVNDYKSDYASNKTFFEPLRWCDIFDEKFNVKDLTRLVSYKGKKREERLCVITERMKAAFLDLWNYLSEPRRAKRLLPEHRAEPDNLIFPETSYKKAWNKIRENTGIKDIRLRDLRRDWSTRLARLGYSDRLAQRGMGHKKLQMTYEYTEFDERAAMLAKKMLDGDIIEITTENN